MQTLQPASFENFTSAKFTTCMSSTCKFQNFTNANFATCKLSKLQEAFWFSFASLANVQFAQIANLQMLQTCKCCKLLQAHNWRDKKFLGSHLHHLQNCSFLKLQTCRCCKFASGANWCKLANASFTNCKFSRTFANFATCKFSKTSHVQSLHVQTLQPASFQRRLKSVKVRQTVPCTPAHHFKSFKLLD